MSEYISVRNSVDNALFDCTLINSEKSESDMMFESQSIDAAKIKINELLFSCDKYKFELFELKLYLFSSLGQFDSCNLMLNHVESDFFIQPYKKNMYLVLYSNNAIDQTVSCRDSTIDDMRRTVFEYVIVNYDDIAALNDWKKIVLEFGVNHKVLLEYKTIKQLHRKKILFSEDIDSILFVNIWTGNRNDFKR